VTSQRLERRHAVGLDLVIIFALSGLCAYLWFGRGSDFVYSWSWEAIPQYLITIDADSGGWRPNLLLQGLLTTIRLSLWSMLLAVPLGFLLGLARCSPELFRRLCGTTYVGLIRNLPPLVMIFIGYYFVSAQLLGPLHLDRLTTEIPEHARQWLSLLFCEPELLERFCAALLTLVLLEAGYIAEIVRAAVQAIDQGQWESGAALGLTRRQLLQHIILPQTAPRMLPPLAGQLISTIKDSAIVSVISIPELTFQGMELMASTYLNLEIWVTITLMYLLLTLSCSLLLQSMEKRLRRS